jgi:hypothetical protein
MLLEDFTSEFARYRTIGERALEQIPDAALNRVPAADANSVAMIVRHIGGNLRSRFTDFLTSDGEKPWRDRDTEFVEREYSRAEVHDWWQAGWSVVEGQLAALSDADLGRQVAIRGQPLTVHAALSRSVAHVAYHVGQIVLLARMMTAEEWRWISIPKGASKEYNDRPNLEKTPR